MSPRIRIRFALLLVCLASCAQSGTVARLCPPGQPCLEGFFPGYGAESCDGARRQLLSGYCTPARFAALKITARCDPGSGADGGPPAARPRCTACTADGLCAEQDGLWLERAREDAIDLACAKTLDDARAATCTDRAGSSCGDGCAGAFSPH